MSNQSAIPKENKMGYKSIPALLFEISLPIMISMLVGALYNIVDSAFVGKYSSDALLALSYVFPIQQLMIAIGVGTGVGINALLSRKLGERDFDGANNIASNGVFLGLLTYVLFAIGVGIGAEPFMRMQTDIEIVIQYGTTYAQICGIFSFGLVAQFVFEKLLQSTGKTGYILLTQGLGAVINIILDPIFIFGFGPIPSMGVAGAAIATVLGQIIGGIIAIILNHAKNHEIKLKIKKFKPDPQIIRNIYKIGVPSIIMMSIASVLVFFFNQILSIYSQGAVTVLGAYFKLQSFVFMPVFGLTNGMVPIVAYNYGAKKRDRIISAYKSCLFIATIIVIVGLLLFQLFPEKILGIFSISDETMKIGIIALRIISWSFVLAGVNIVSSSLFQALGNGVFSMIMAFLRQLIFALPAAVLLGRLFGVNAVWWAFPIAEVLCTALCVFFVIQIFRSKLSESEMAGILATSNDDII